MNRSSQSRQSRPAEPPRKVEFVVVSDRLAASALAQMLGAEPDASQTGTERFPTQATWELRATGGGDDDLSSLIQCVLRRVRPLTKEIAALKADDPDLVCVLRIVQYIGDHLVGPGFALEHSDVTLLSGLGAFIDVDQYYVE